MSDYFYSLESLIIKWRRELTPDYTGVIPPISQILRLRDEENQ